MIGHRLQRPGTNGVSLSLGRIIPPEQYRSDPLDSRTDQFSFCAALYEALYQQLPFAGKELADLAGEILLGKVRPVPKESPVPPLIAEVLRRGMALDPEQRFPSMAELLQALAIDPRHDPAGAPRPRRLFSVIVLGGLAILVSGLILKGGSHKASGEELLNVSVFMLLVILGAGWWQRRSLQQNSYHRGMARLVLLAAVQLFTVRLLALLAGLSTPQTLTMDFASLIAVGTLMAWDYTPAAWPVPVGCFVLGIVSARFPHLALPLGSVFLPASAAIFLLGWNRAVRRRAVRRRAERKARMDRKDPSPPGPPGSRPGPSSGE